MVQLKNQLEKQIISFLWSQPSFFYQAMQNLTEDLFQDKQHKELFNYFLLEKRKISYNESGFNQSVFLERLKGDNKELYSYLINNNEYLSISELRGAISFLKEEALKSKLVKIQNTISSILKNPSINSNEILTILKEEFDALISADSDSLMDIVTVTHEWVSRIDRTNPTVYTPFLPELKDSMQTYPADEITLVAAGTGIGKSQFLINQCAYSAYVQGIPVLYITPEMKQDQFMNRIMSLISFQKETYGIPHTISKIDAKLFDRNQAYRREYGQSMMSEEDWKTIKYIRDNVINPNANLLFTQWCNRGTAYPIEIESWIRSIINKTGKKPIVLIDYFQLLDLPVQTIGDNSMSIKVITKDSERLAAISGQLRQIAKSLEIPIVMGAQITEKAIEGNPTRDKRPSGNCVFGTAKAKHDAGCLLYLYREEYYMKEKTPHEKKGQIEIILDKVRQGESGKIIKATANFAYSSICSKLENPDRVMPPTF